MNAARKPADDSARDAIVSFYATGLSFSDCLALARVPRDVGERWRQDPEFDQALQRSKAGTKLSVIEKLHAAAGADDPWQKWLAILGFMDPATFGPPQLQLKAVNVTQNIQNNVTIAQDLALKAAQFVKDAIAEEDARTLAEGSQTADREDDDQADEGGQKTYHF